MTSKYFSEVVILSDERMYSRVSPELHAKLKSGAAKSGLSFNQYINNLLLEQHSNEEFREHIIEMLHEVLNVNNSIYTDFDRNINIEILTYLRVLSSPEQRVKVKGELLRLGRHPTEINNE